VLFRSNGATYVLLEGHEQDVRQELSQLNGFALCEMPSQNQLMQRTNLDRLSHNVPHSIERSIRKQFDPSNKLNKHIAAQRDLLT
jgi:hypothetical protein